MLRLLSGFAALAIGIAGACASERTDKSTGTNWIQCDTDDDCSSVPGARCGAESVCVDDTGNPVTAAGSGGAGSGSGGSASGSGGRSSGAGGAASGGAGPAGGTPGDSGTESSGGGTSRSPACYSPGQNYERAYDPGMVGCECPEWAETGICIGRAALLCNDGRWQAVEDGPCMGCWTPDDPTNAVNRPTAGCPCTEEDQPACMHTVGNGYMRGVCTDGKWRLQVDAEPCGCTSDAQCGFGSRCEDGKCLEGHCEVDGVRYALGVTGIPDPGSCNTCTCEENGLGCTKMECPEACPEGGTYATVCAECGPADGCAVYRTGCFGPCSDDETCGQGSYCDPRTSVCPATCG